MCPYIQSFVELEFKPLPVLSLRVGPGTVHVDDDDVLILEQSVRTVVGADLELNRIQALINFWVENVLNCLIDGESGKF